MKDFIETIRTELETAFAGLDGWFDEPEPVLTYRPANGGWTARQILEHVGLTNHYLLILIRKGREGALVKAARANLRETMAGYSFNEVRLREIGVPGSFYRHRPDHMEPGGESRRARSGNC